MANVAVVNIDLGGHLGPAVRLGGALAALGHRIVIWAPMSARDRILAAGAEFVPHAPSAFDRDWPGIPGFAVRQAQASRDCLPDLLDELLARDVELIVHDVHAPWGRLAAEYLGLPRLVSDPLYPPWAPQARPTPSVSPDAPRRQATSEHAAVRNQLLARWGVDIGDIEATLRSPGGVRVGFSTAEVLGAAPPAGWCLAGPLMEPVPRGPQDDPPLVYAALGTFMNRSRDAFAVIAGALGTLEVRAIISTGGSFTADELAPLPSNVTVHGYVDSRAVLAQAAVHVTHGGASSVHESLVAGVPMVCLPIGSDQHAWSARMLACGAGIGAEWRAAAVAAAVAAQLASPRARATTRALGEAVLAHPGRAQLAATVEAVLAGG
jgi:MGT family glycosyltransferase